MKRVAILTFQHKAMIGLALGCAIGTSATLAYGQVGTLLGSSSSPTVSNQAVAQELQQFWTADKLNSAKPVELSPKELNDQGLPKASLFSAFQFSPNTPGERSEGAAPSFSLDKAPENRSPALNTFTLSTNRENALLENSHVIPEATSSYGAFFTTGRVFPDAAVTTYPYSAAGKLFFSDPHGGNFVCSASVLRPRLIVTAGHCVTHPSTNPSDRYFYTNFLFVPAYNNGAAPLKSWTSSRQWVANAWYFSNGGVPNEQDVAILIANDLVIDGQPRKIGNVTGWLGYYTQQLANNNLTMLGYPCNLDSCQRMEITNAQTFASGGSNTYVYGSAMRGGASGGSWIQDFGVNPVSNPVVPLGNNYLVGVTSYGPVATDPKYLGASNLDARFLDVLKNACASNPGNCP